MSDSIPEMENRLRSFGEEVQKKFLNIFTRINGIYIFTNGPDIHDIHFLSPLAG